MDLPHGLAKMLRPKLWLLQICIVGVGGLLTFPAVDAVVVCDAVVKESEW